jgi:nitrogen fixation/metabolism regulation signal transduction histidine kinase
MWGMARLANDVALLSGTLQNLNLGVVTVASDLTVTFANREAERIFSLCDGINRIRGKLVLGDSDRQSALAAAVSECAKSDIGRASPYVFVRRPERLANMKTRTRSITRWRASLRTLPL